jgi:hypothetical protein
MLAVVGLIRLDDSQPVSPFAWFRFGIPHVPSSTNWPLEVTLLWIIVAGATYLRYLWVSRIDFRQLESGFTSQAALRPNTDGGHWASDRKIEIESWIGLLESRLQDDNRLADAILAETVARLDQLRATAPSPEVCRYLLTRLRNQRLTTQRPAVSELNPRVDQFEAVLTHEQAVFLAQMLTNPKQVVARLSDQVEPATRTLSVTSTFTLHIPRGVRHLPLVIPVAFAERGQLMDSVRVLDGDGKRVSTLDQESATACLAAALRLVISSGLPPDGPEVGQLRENYVREVEPDVLELLQSTEIPARRLYATIRDALNELAALFPDHAPQISVVRVMIRKVRNLYPLLVSAPAMVSSPQPRPDRDMDGSGVAVVDHQAVVEMRIVVHQRVIPALILSGVNWTVRRRELLRLRFGVTPSAIAYGVRWADRARSYHVTIHGPENTYLSRQRLFNRLEPDMPMGAVSTIQAMRMRRGQRYGHLYLRDAAFPPGVEPWYIGYFYERPPGSLATPAISALAAMLMIPIAAAISLGYAADHSDIVVFLLTLPAVIGAWAGTDRDMRIAGPRIGARIARAITIFVTFVSVALYFICIEGRSDLADAGAIWTRPYYAAWVIVTAIAVTNVVACAGAWLLATSLYSYFSMRSSAVAPTPAEGDLHESNA